MGSSEVGQAFFENLLQVQADKCGRIVQDVRELCFDQGVSSDKLDLVGKIQSEVDEMEESTQELFDNRNRIRDINLHLRRILIAVANDFGYKQKLYDEHNNIQDDLSTLFYWFRLVAKPNLGSDFREVAHEYAIHECRRKRNDIEHGESGDRIRPDAVAVGVLTWYSLHEILWNWKRAQRQIIHDNLSRIQNDGSEYGFICKLNEDDSEGAPHSITQYDTGEEGNNIAFTLEDIEQFPEVGDVVTYTESNRDSAPIAIDISIL